MNLDNFLPKIEFDSNNGELKAMSIDELRQITQQLREARPIWKYEKALDWHKAWLSYYEACEKKSKQKNRCIHVDSPVVPRDGNWICTKCGKRKY